MQHLPDALLPGRPYPLGATWDGLGINFAVFSAHAERIDLCLFDPSGRREIARYTCRNTPTRSGTAICPTRRPGLLYGYRALAPTSRSTAIASTSTSCCSIPMRGALAGSCTGPMRCTASALNSPRADLSFDRRDSAPAMLKGVVTDDSSTGATIVRPPCRGRTP